MKRSSSRIKLIALTELYSDDLEMLELIDSEVAANEARLALFGANKPESLSPEHLHQYGYKYNPLLSYHAGRKAHRANEYFYFREGCTAETINDYAAPSSEWVQEIRL